jgi:hypothetical protein
MVLALVVKALFPDHSAYIHSLQNIVWHKREEKYDLYGFSWFVWCWNLFRCPSRHKINLTGSHQKNKIWFSLYCVPNNVYEISIIEQLQKPCFFRNCKNLWKLKVDNWTRRLLANQNTSFNLNFKKNQENTFIKYSSVLRAMFDLFTPAHCHFRNVICKPLFGDTETRNGNPAAAL